MSPLAIIGAACKAFGEYMGWINKRTELNNTPVMQKAATAQKDTNTDEKIVNSVREADLKSVRDRLSH